MTEHESHTHPSCFYRLHGLTVRSELDLPEPTGPPSDPDLELLWDGTSDTPVPEMADDNEEVLAQSRGHDQFLYRMSKLDQSIAVEFPGICRFTIDHDLRLVRARRDPDGSQPLASILAAGHLMAFLLALRGICVLHASSVTIDGMGVGIIGSAGMGKSSLAALLCSAGARLVTDDVLRIEVEADPPLTVRGSSYLRLRPQAWPILDLFEEIPDTEKTTDGRLAVFPRRAAETAPLNAVLIPRRGTDRDLTVERLSGAEALWMLIQYPRIYGWRSEEVLSRSFQQLADLVGKVPVVALSMPWGPPFEKEMATAVLEKTVDVLGR